MLSVTLKTMVFVIDDDTDFLTKMIVNILYNDMWLIETKKFLIIK